MSSTAEEKIHADAYYTLPEYATHDLIQLIDGVVVFGKAKPIKHQAATGNLLVALMKIERRIGGEALPGPIEVYLDEYNIFEPDIIYMTASPQCEVTEKRIIGAPALVVEALSPGTAKHDRWQKYKAYEKHGVREYWIVDPGNRVIEVWARSEAGTFEQKGVYERGDVIASATLGEDVSVAEIFREDV